MKFLASTLAAALVATSAFASGPVVIEEPPVTVIPQPAYDWSGGYVGLHAGVALGDNFWAERSVPAASLPGDWGGTPWGLTAGYDRQRGNLVFGVALDYTAGAIEASPTTNPGVYNCGGCNTTVENSFALRGRIGRAMDRTLVYVTAGFAGGDATAWSPGPLIHGSDSLSGWVAGFGVERAVTNRLSIFAEYLHTDLGRLEIPTACSINCFTDVSYGTLRIGGNLRW